VFKGLESLLGRAEKAEIPEEWLKQARREISHRGREEADRGHGLGQAHGDARRSVSKEQKGRHQGGNKWIGTAGTSPFGADGYNPEGIRIGQEKNRNNRAVKVWDKREFKDLDGNVELGIRNIKVALRRLRKFARTGAPDELDLDTTIKRNREPRLSRRAHAARAAQRGEGADVLRYWRLDGLAHRAGRGAVLGGEDRVQAHGVFLLPQLPL
jgi:uncharacterized protein with von Willebrand factor type A (vWA) domain